LKLAVFGLHYSDFAHCSDNEAPSDALAFRESQFWDNLRFGASWTQLGYAIEGLIARGRGEGPKYHADGTRSAISKLIVDLGVDGKTPRYWRKIRRELPDDSKAEPRFEFGTKCRQLMGKARELADRHGFALVVVFLPRNNDLLSRLNWNGPNAREEIGRFLAQVSEVVPHVIDLSISGFSDSQNFWLDDSTHFKPAIGARIVEEAIDRSLGAQVSK
jgi:hypothetical protein